MAASAASFIALAGKELLMSPTSRFMIHNPYIPSIEMNKGDAKEFQQVASSLFKDENMMIKIYSEKTGKTPEEIKSMMDEETTFFASEAIENGFADGIILVNNLLPMNCIGFKEDNKQTELYTIKLQEEYFKMKNKLQLNAAIVKSIANELGIEEETVENVAEKIEAAEETVEAPKEEVEETVAEAEEEVVEEEVKAEVIDKAELMELITALTVDGSINAEELITALSAPSPEAAYKALFIARKNTQIKAKVTARKEIQTLNSVAAPNKSDELKSGWMLKPLSIR
jgi:membrane-bound ClpP family serine protease